MDSIIHWFTGGPQYHYHTLAHCLDGDLVVMSLAVLLCSGVFIGYWIIASRWSKAAGKSRASSARQALNDLKWIFILCGICGYLWVLMETVWPAWRLYLFFLLALNFFTWRYVLGSIKGLESVYRYLEDRDMIVREIMVQKEEIARLKEELHHKK